MRDFRSFVPSEKKSEKTVENKGVYGDKREGESVDKTRIEDEIKQREGRTEDELMSELLESVSKAKREGKFSESELENFQKTVKPFLSSEQTKRLDEIIAVLQEKK